MEFSGQYLTYAEYKALGGTLDQTPFNLLEFEARRQIDTKTLNRLKNGTNIPQEVKLCDYKLINSLASYDDTLNGTLTSGNIASENIDGYSVSYMNSKEAVESKNTEIDDIVNEYLFGVIYNGEHLIYSGVD